eukprot:186290-Rhodomonas_salina.5
METTISTNMIEISLQLVPNSTTVLRVQAVAGGVGFPTLSGRRAREEREEERKLGQQPSPFVGDALRNFREDTCRGA